MKLIATILMLALPWLANSQNKSTTFKLCDLLETNYKFPEMELHKSLETQVGKGVEAWSKLDQNIINSSYHPFVGAVHNAYASHRRLVISPDMIWLLIAQGFAQHVDQNGEELHHYFVDFDGKKVLKVVRNGFSKGSTDNDWAGVFPEFTQQIGEYTGQELLNTTLVKFSTTGLAEKAAFEVTLMDAMSSYFIYAVYTTCGIPEITLEGTTADWKLLLEKAEALKQYELGWWINDLTPVLKQFVKASEGKVDKAFWNDMYKKSNPGSGTPYITGWITKFFPYVVRSEKIVQNKNLSTPLTTDNFTSGMSKADFYWIYFGSTFQMEFLAGFSGMTQDPKTGALRPLISWAIRDTGETGIKEEDAKYTEDILIPPR